MKKQKETPVSGLRRSANCFWNAAVNLWVVPISLKPLIGLIINQSANYFVDS